MSNVLMKTDFQFENQTQVYKGKVRDTYVIGDDTFISIVTDRLSAFDVILPKGIPYKGQILNQIASKFLRLTEDIVPNWMIGTPDPNVTIGKLCKPFKVEMVVRGYLSGHAARVYKSGERELCGVKLPEGLKENDAFETPIITPTTKASIGGHDQDVSRDDVLFREIATEEEYNLLEKYSLELFRRGTEIAKDRGLLLVDTKYEFGKTSDGQIVLIDEIHTPDSSRYFYENTYEFNQRKGYPQRQLSKEFVREWLISEGFQGKYGQKVPLMTDTQITKISKRYIELYEKVMGEMFIGENTQNIEKRIFTNVTNYLSNH